MFNKKYKKGMADAAKAYEAFGQKQADALGHILEEVRQGKRDLESVLKELNGNIDGLYDYLQSKEKAKLYTVYTPFDIKNLDQQAQLFLVGALFRLTVDKAPNENQQNYLRAIQKYLEVKEPPFGVDPVAVANIDSNASQKAILQTVLEYLCLQDGDSYDETELQQNFLAAFNVNDATRKEITKHVELLYTATGAKGLAEKYGYVPEEEVNTDDIGSKQEKYKEGCSSDIEEKVADTLIKGDGTDIKFCIETSNFLFVFPTSLKSLDKRTGTRVAFENLPQNVIDMQLLLPHTDCVMIESRIQSNDKAFHRIGVYDLISQQYKELPCGENSLCLRAKNGYIIYNDYNTKETFIYDTHSNKIKGLPVDLNGYYVTAADIVDETMYFLVNGSQHSLYEMDLKTFQVAKKFNYPLRDAPNVIRVVDDYVLCRSEVGGDLPSRLTISKINLGTGNTETLYSDNEPATSLSRVHVYDDSFIYRDKLQGALWIVGNGYNEPTKLVTNSNAYQGSGSGATFIYSLLGGLMGNHCLDDFPRIGKWIYYSKKDSSEIYKVNIEKPLQTEIVR